MSPASIWTPALISYRSPDQGRMAGASTSAYKYDSVVRASTFRKVYGLHSLTGVVNS